MKFSWFLLPSTFRSLLDYEVNISNFIPFFPIAEFTTMAGRRLRDAVRTALKSSSSQEFAGNVHVVIAGLTNTYSQYITTFEEYQIQRYEVSFLFSVEGLCIWIAFCSKILF